MKKLTLLITAATLAASSVAMATNQNSEHTFVALSAGYVTNNPYGISNTAEWLKNQDPANTYKIDNKKHEFQGTLAVGTDLSSIDSDAAIGVEVDTNYSAIAPEIKFTKKADQTNATITMTRLSADPMLFVRYAVSSDLSVALKGGYGYQRVNIKGKDTSNSVNIPASSNDRSFDKTVTAWKPVAAVELAYELTDSASLIAGDRYTFGDTDKHAALTILDPAQKAIMPTENVAYVGVSLAF